MTTDRLDEIEARLAASTPGPWEARRRATVVTIAAYTPRTPRGWTAVAQVGRNHAYGSGEGDADLIAHAPADLAALAAVVAAVREIHKPHRTHNPISNPDFWYQVCTTCADSEGEAHLWPCPTAATITTLLERP